LSKAIGLRRRVNEQGITCGGLAKARDGLVDLTSCRTREPIGIAR
jgi:hypothetical protein